MNNALRGDGGQCKANEIKTLIREFYYPRRGPGMMWTRMKEVVEQRARLC